MSITESLDAIRNGATYDESHAVVKEILQRVLRREMTTADYEAAWGVFKVRWPEECRASGLMRSDQERGGPRCGSNWTGD